MRVRWTTPALRDIEAIVDGVAAHDPKAAANLSDRIFDLVDKLKLHPHLGRPGRVDGTRELVVTGTPYIVPYRVQQTGIEILTVFHGARRWPERFA